MSNFRSWTSIPHSDSTGARSRQNDALGTEVGLEAEVTSKLKDQGDQGPMKKRIVGPKEQTVFTVKGTVAPLPPSLPACPCLPACLSCETPDLSTA